MNSHDFTYLLQNPQDINPQKTEALQSILQKFPYFQPAKALFLKGLKNQESTDYNQTLKITAAYTTDRSILFDFITSEVFIQNEISQIIKWNTSLNDIEVSVDDISVNKKRTIDDTLKAQIKETSGVLDPELFQPKDPSQVKKINKENTSDNSDTTQTSAEAILNLGKPLQFNKRETHSFNEWLKLTRFKPIKRTEKPESAHKTPTGKPPEDSDKVRKFKLVDKFITQNPKISPSKTSATKGNLAKAQMIQPEALMTETLARIYLEQKNYKKAIQAYKILSLKYPEKSGFFANQIKAVEQLQENNKE